MLLQEYTQARANKLAKLSFSEASKDTGITLHWIRWVSYENNEKLISRQKHKHSFYEVHFLLSGTNDYSVNNNDDIKLTEGTGIIIPPESTHRVKSISEDLTKISVTLSLKDEISVFSNSELKAPSHFVINSEIIAELNAIMKEADRIDGFSQTIIKNRIYNILCEISRSQSPTEATATAYPKVTADVRVLSAKRYIEDNVNLFLTCEDVAKYCHFNTKYLNRIFKAQTGQTILEYVHEVKLTEAERLLRETSLPLSEIAQALGFSNEYYFNTFFKRYSTVSPGTYRKTVGNKSLPK